VGLDFGVMGPRCKFLNISGWSKLEKTRGIGGNF
jgi:hypothetical protein